VIDSTEIVGSSMLSETINKPARVRESSLPTASSVTYRPGSVLLALRRRWMFPVGGLIVGALLGLALASATGANYTASSSVLITPLVGNAYSVASTGTATDLATSVNTEALVAVSDPVLEIAGDLPGTDLTATVETNSQVIRISASDSAAGDAVETANTVAEAYLQYRSELANRIVEGQQARLESRIVALRELVGQDRERLRTATSKQAKLLSQRISSNLGQVFSLSSQVAELGTGSPGRVLVSATADGAPRGLLSLALTLGLALVGAVIGFGWAVARRRR